MAEVPLNQQIFTLNERIFTAESSKIYTEIRVFLHLNQQRFYTKDQISITPESKWTFTLKLEHNYV